MAKLTVCGGGNAAHTLIALAQGAGWEVDIYAPYDDEARRLHTAQLEGGGVTARFAGERTVQGVARCISDQPADVIPGSAVVLLALPAFAHGSTLRQIAPCLDPGATVGVLPARSGFEYDVQALFPSSRFPYTFFGLQTLPWACRINAYGREVDVLGTKASVDIAAWPAENTPQLARQLRSLFGVDLRPVSSFLTLTLGNTGQLIHPGIMYGLCAGCEERSYSAETVPLFYQGVDDHTADLLQSMSDEVQALAAALEERVPGFTAAEVTPLHRWLLQAYPQDVEDGSTLRAAFNSNRAYAGLKLPLRRRPDGEMSIDFSARYLSEDVPFGLVVLRGIAELAGVHTPAIDRVISWAQERLGHSYLLEGALRGPDLASARAPQSYGINALSDLTSWNVTIQD